MTRKILATIFMLLNSTWLQCAEKDFTETKYGIEMVHIKGGEFNMGCAPEWKNCEADELPAHKVKVSDFYIGRYEVTQKQWREIMGTAAREHWYEEKPSFGEGDNYPMYYVNWYEAVEFCNKLSELTGRKPVYRIDKTMKDPNNEGVWEDRIGKKWIVTVISGANGYRLPTEAEWEYAARGGAKSKGYKYSGSNNLDDVAWYWDNSARCTHEAGSKQPNELGIYDMSGNVWEWCWDWYGPYSDNAQTDPIGAASGFCRVIRGGAWNSSGRSARSASRCQTGPDSWSHDIGFRLARSGL